MKTKPSFDEEEILWNTGYDFAIGIDEVGRVAFAGPIFAAAVVFQLLKPKERETLAVEIKKSALFYSIASIGVGVINKKGIGVANKMVFRKVIAQSLLKLEGETLRSGGRISR
ncbi:MAG: ribonuclease HII, ribonuclease HII [Candidatus Levybacteria bacterium GW2011_GWC1_40_19]|nr:MAG: ribonuclease HII, ribonuclease HII [Candidatus Levybacteria bacterium GW2011_GWC1_40_19]